MFEPNFELSMTKTSIGKLHLIKSEAKTEVKNRIGIRLIIRGKSKMMRLDIELRG
jgi:hypothetical protein